MSHQVARKHSFLQRKSEAAAASAIVKCMPCCQLVSAHCLAVDARRRSSAQPVLLHLANSYETKLSESKRSGLCLENKWGQTTCEPHERTGQNPKTSGQQHTILLMTDIRYAASVYGDHSSPPGRFWACLLAPFPPNTDGTKIFAMSRSDMSSLTYRILSAQQRTLGTLDGHTLRDALLLGQFCVISADGRQSELQL
ncbi:uncharacterized protein SPSK_04564 [Sporothrix schenckii 1099-18]|uniref:Uncharacterized protein n=1 Tax=Sporothrix schenckii 1099-18 TaxID=1397361 RepID=A0A0F2M3X7_SPOSC|nr:uncharacterized protein SPSK_04564 [Sporothrix schenckii 1099-18]KJR82871.1 hypothetical protein SPSK_04564 [Sporothrix schenckii 1099-18]